MKKSVILGGICLLIVLIGLVITVQIATVEGNEIGVLETWSEGVVPESLPAKTYIWVPGFNKKLYSYEISQQVYVMNNKDGGDEYGNGRKSDAYRVQSSEGQDMDISLRVQWRRDPLKVVELHQIVGMNVEELVLRPELQRIVKDEATTRTALEAYSGAGLVELQQAIQSSLQDDTGKLYGRGVIVDSFVIEHIGLDPKYVGEIKEKQIAIQSRLKSIEQTAAAVADAEKAKAEAQADYEKQVVESERDKTKGVLKAEQEAAEMVLAAGANASKVTLAAEAQATQVVLAAEAQAKQVTLAAEADKARNVLAAEGDKEAGVLRAQAIIALGEAEAQATKLKLAAYNTDGADAFVKIELGKSMANAFQNIDGYLPENMSINLLAEQYTSGVNMLVSPNTAQ